MTLRYVGPGGQVFALEQFRAHVLEPDIDQWNMVGGGANVWRSDLTGRPVRLDVIFHPDHGFYLQYAVESPLPEASWVTVGDRSRFSEWVDVGDGHHASVGLFIDAAAAWTAIEEFVERGARSERVSWIETGALPSDANW